jgi:hypothetical protein
MVVPMRAMTDRIAALLRLLARPIHLKQEEGGEKAMTSEPEASVEAAAEEPSEEAATEEAALEEPAAGVTEEPTAAHEAAAEGAAEEQLAEEPSEATSTA